MKIAIVLTLFMCAFLPTNAQMDIPGDGGNIKASVSEEVGITSITVNYSRPAVKGREGKIWGGVVADGFGAFNFLTSSMSSPWRAGANEATTISFEHDVKVEGQDIQAGTYALFMAMESDKATLIFSKQVEAWGSFYYKKEDDVLRVEVQTATLENSVERLKYEFIEHQENYCILALQWEKRSVPFKIEVEVDDIILKRVRQQLISSKGFVSGNLIQASRYFFSKNIHLEEALSWAKKAVDGKPFGQTSFVGYQNLAMGYEKLNQAEKADSTMKIALRNENSFQRYLSYNKACIKKGRAKEAIEIMLMAKAAFGDVYGVNNALSYAYSAEGLYDKALDHAHLALTQASSAQSKSKVRENIAKLERGTDINE